MLLKKLVGGSGYLSFLGVGGATPGLPGGGTPKGPGIALASPIKILMFAKENSEKYCISSISDSSITIPAKSVVLAFSLCVLPRVSLKGEETDFAPQCTAPPHKYPHFHWSRGYANLRRPPLPTG